MKSNIEPIDSKYYEKFIKDYIYALEEINPSVTFKDVLYDPYGNSKIAYLYSVENGYAIIGIDSMNIYEFSLSTDNPYRSVIGKKYYSGYFEYYDSSKVHIYEKYKFSDESSMMFGMEKNTSLSVQKNSRDDFVIKANSVKKLSRALPTDWVNGYCGPTSAYNMLKYKSYVPLSYTSGTDAIKYINSLINPNGGSGVSLSTLTNGMNKALSNWGYVKRVSSTSYSFPLIKQQINKDCPLTLGTSGGGLATGGHVQTVHGYAELTVSTTSISTLNMPTATSPTYVIYVNNSWGKNDVTLSYTGNPPTYLKDHVYYV